MPRKRFTNEQIAFALWQAEALFGVRPSPVRSNLTVIV
jgi:hypothetical protein